jgi:hypothetical protein
VAVGQQNSFRGITPRIIGWAEYAAHIRGKRRDLMRGLGLEERILLKCKLKK